VRAEDKAEIAAVHGRGAPDEAAAEEAVRSMAERAEAEGLHVHWGRKVLEVRPAVEVDKGAGVAWLLADADVDHAIYVGDDTTDLDAFRGLRALVASGRLESAVCVGVRSDETPPELEREADLLVDGPAGVRSVLEALL
jgi:trehalose 6-phosphate phosphatase